MNINTSTKIAALIKEHPGAIDAIASINPHFKKLQNPVLRKIFASRVTIGDAARIGKCDINLFFEKLKPLGFIADEVNETNREVKYSEVSNLEYDMLLDVREDIASSKDPFRKIMQAITDLSNGNVLLLINSFEPLPLISILKEKGCTADVVEIGPGEVHTFFKKQTEENISSPSATENEFLFNDIKNRFEGCCEVIDVRQLPMPQPMITILKALESLDEHKALFVHHKKVPLFLLPELKEKNFEYVFKHTEGGVELIIYRHTQ